MKKISAFIMAVCMSLVFAQGVAAAEKPRLGIMRFSNHTHASWWGVATGQELQDMLIAELASTKAFRVLERRELDAVLDEQQLGASGLVNKKTAAKIGNLTGAKYLVAATVSAFEEDTSGKSGGISLWGVSVGGDKGKAYVAVDLKVIDTETGEIYDTRTVEATSASSGLRVGLNLFGFSGDLGTKAKTPTGKAIRGCVVEIASYLECSLGKGKDASCIQEYNEKESKRRERTKGSIELE